MSPPHPGPPTTSPSPMVDTPINPLHCAVVASLPANVPLCGRKPPGFSRSGGSSPMSPSWKIVPSALPPCRRLRKSWYPPPYVLRSSTSKPTSAVPSYYFWLFTANNCPTQSAPAPGIWMMIPRRVGAHRPRRPSPILHILPPPPGARFSSLPSLRTYPWQGGSLSDPARLQTCCT